MPVPTRVQPEKNIWVAAGDGDLPRVQASYLPNCRRLMCLLTVMTGIDPTR